jgi:hypothetical protein
MMACRFLTKATFEGMPRKASFGEQFISDLSAVTVLLVCEIGGELRRRNQRTQRAR